MLNYKTMKFIRDDDKFKQTISKIKNPYVLYKLISIYLDDIYLLYNTETNGIMFSNAFFPMSKDIMYEVETDIVNKYDIYIEEKYYEDNRCGICNKYLNCSLNNKKCKEKNIIYTRVECSSNLWIDIRGMEKINEFLKEE